MKKKLKIYVLILSKVFPAWHPRKGEPTEFKKTLLNALQFQRTGNVPTKMEFIKLHTLREYELWHKRFDIIERGEACLSIREWSGKPYHSKQVEIARLTKEDGIGLQMLRFARFSDGFVYIDSAHVDNHDVQGVSLANNDGLIYNDWEEFVARYDLNKPLAIIHFTKFRY